MSNFQNSRRDWLAKSEEEAPIIICLGNTYLKKKNTAWQIIPSWWQYLISKTPHSYPIQDILKEGNFEWKMSSYSKSVKFLCLLKGTTEDQIWKTLL